MAHVPTNIDKSRSPVAVPFTILGVMSLLALVAMLVAISSHG